MATRGVETPSINGLAATYHAASAGGDAVAIGSGRTVLHVKNGSAAAVTVGVVTPGTIATGALPDLAVSVPAGGERFIGPLDPVLFNDPATSLASVTWSATASVTFAVLSL